MTEQVFVARERELAQLQSFLDLALSGQGQVCFVTGEAGAGKTALVREFARRAQKAHADLVVAMGNCDASTGIGDPYLPFREILGLLTGDVEAKLSQGAITQENAKRLRGLSIRAVQVLIELGPDLVGVLVPGGSLVAKLGKTVAEKLGWLDKLEKAVQPKQQRPDIATAAIEQSRIFEQYASVLKDLAVAKPLILVVDDAHWVDASSSELLFHLARRIGGSRILIVGTYRPEDVALGRAGEQHPLERVASELKRYFGDVWVPLDLADAVAGRQFVDALLDSEPNRLGEDFRRALYRHTDGHPLFTIELLRDMQERGDLARDADGRWVEGSALDWNELPAKVEGVIETRLGRLTSELRQVLTVASVEGEAFTAQVVARVQEVAERQLVRQLSQKLDKQHRLVQEEGAERLGSQRLSFFRFRHRLIQAYLYDDLGQAERELLHEDVGRVLEALYGGQEEEISGQLARHFDEAGIPEKAIEYLLQAGKRAIKMSANQEAIAHLARGMELLGRLPETPEKTRQELALQIALGQPLIATKGYAAPEVGHVYARALELCRQLGESPQLFSALWGSWLFYLVRAELQTAREVGEQLLKLAQDAQDPAMLLEADHALWATLFHLGELGASRVHVEQGITVYDAREHGSHAFLYGSHDPGVCCWVYQAWILWLCGHPDQALESYRNGLTLARDVSHPYSLAYAFLFAAVLHHFRREGSAAQEQAEAAIALATEQGFPHYLASGTVLRGWGLAEQGQIDEGLAEMRKGLADLLATDVEFLRPLMLGMLADGYGRAGQAENGLKVLDEALAEVDKSEERVWEAELYRLKGDLLLVQGAAQTEAEASFRRAIEVARRQSAKSWELRATTRLCGQLRQQGRGAEGRRMLAEAYGWFTEGLDTPDLRDARALLEELSGPSYS